MLKLDKADLETRTNTLNQIKVQLKTEFFGLDHIIDDVIDSLRVWYIFPQLIIRPVIINLWGLTGVGKTQLVRRIAELLEFRNQFIEIQMDGTTPSRRYMTTSIAGILQESSIDQGQPGIILLDEFQRFRTVGSHGEDVATERFSDVWMLLSDGKFAADATQFQSIEMMLMGSLYDQERDDDTDDDDGDATSNADRGTPSNQRKKSTRQFHIYPYTARNIKQLLCVADPLEDIMKWDENRLREELRIAMRDSAGRQLDYTKMLIFVSGNLDEAFSVANQINDCDTDADVYYETCKQVTIPVIKRALRDRFKPEQISRLGNKHIVYPSISKKSYQQIIHATCQQYINGMHDITGINFELTPRSEQVIYENSVYPSQGTRPVFSSIHNIFSNGLVSIAFWAINNNQTDLTIDINADTKTMDAYTNAVTCSYSIPVSLDIDEIRKSASKEFVYRVMVHEAGHTLATCLLTKTAPFELRANAASFNGGYTIASQDTDELIGTSDLVTNNIQILLAGRAAEYVVFGQTSSGADNDIRIATRTIARALGVSNLTFDGESARVGCIGIPSRGDSINVIDRSEELYIDMSAQLNSMNRDVMTLIQDNQQYLIRLVDALFENQVLTQKQIIELLPELHLSGNTQEQDVVSHWTHYKDKVLAQLGQ